MKKFICISCLVLILLSCQASKASKTGSIELFHYGECDKYIQTLMYTKTIDSFTMETEYVKVSANDFDILQDYLIQHNSNNTCDTCYPYYGSYRVSILTNDSKRVYYLIEGRKNSLAFFNNFKQYLINKKVNYKIIENLDDVIIRSIDHSVPIEKQYESEAWKKKIPHLK